MIKVNTSIARSSRTTRRLYPPQNGLGSLHDVDTIHSDLDTVRVAEFRQRAFIPEKPILISPRTGANSNHSISSKQVDFSIPAAVKWFSHRPIEQHNEATKPETVALSEYLLPFAATVLPYELIVDSNNSIQNWVKGKVEGDNLELATYLSQLLKDSEGGAFHRFSGPLALFLQANGTSSGSPLLQRLYIAQAQIADLPKQLQDDLPTPRLVKEAGKGDVYDANIWMGIPPTYSPLHKDPNPNLFVQLASSKRVRLFRPRTGAVIFREVQQRIGQSSSSSFRGDEMMEGPERDALNKSVWGQAITKEGFEVTVNPGDALFIPKGWWHSIKSIGENVNASVNWWFR